MEMADIPVAAPGSGEPRIGVALGGGSARGFAHIGALDVLESHGVGPHVLAGTSFGALVGALYASGQAPARLAEAAEAQQLGDLLFRIADLGLHRGALMAGKRFERYLDDLFEGRSFEDLAIPFVVVATDVETGERIMLESGPLARAVRASCAMPGLMAPVEIEGRRLIDGGIGTPAPLDTLQDLEVDLAIGIGAGKEQRDSRTLRGARRFLESLAGQRMQTFLGKGDVDHPVGRLRLALALTADSWLAKRARAPGLEVHTQPPIDWFHFHRAEDAVAAGRSALEAFMPEIRAALDDLGTAA